MTPRIDWWRVIADLGVQGYSLRRISDELMVGKSWLDALKNQGHEPRHRDGEMLLQLWAQAMGKEMAEAPRAALGAEGARERWRLGLNRPGNRA